MAFTRLPAAALTAVTLALGGAALAPAPAEAQSQGAEAQSFSEAQLEAFAIAAIEVRTIRERYVPQIQQAGSEEDKQQLAQQAQQEMQGAVEGTSGITIADYNAIIQAASQDQQLAQRISAIIQETAQN